MSAAPCRLVKCSAPKEVADVTQQGPCALGPLGRLALVTGRAPQHGTYGGVLLGLASGVGLEATASLRAASARWPSFFSCRAARQTHCCPGHGSKRRLGSGDALGVTVRPVRAAQAQAREPPGTSWRHRCRRGHPSRPPARATKVSQPKIGSATTPRNSPRQGSRSRIKDLK